ncbi:MAG: anhydro-N-acetylmuramic acid kinase [Armatimonadetes bacterium]|nr:anhydro-N-acetylmuramic acid kinase [Armatimonadota bacterium]
MSGTSVDGIDAALVEISGGGPSARVRLLAFENVPFSTDLRERILALCSPETGTVDKVCAMNAELGELFAQAAMRVAERAGLGIAAVDLIGSHGQTVWHIPPASGVPGATLQIGEPAVIAERTGVLTVADFRVRDMAAGGMGAPLVPYADIVLFGHPARARAVQNLGGIGNVTVLPAAPTMETVYAFDTGPANMVIDAVVEIVTRGRQTYDRDGVLAGQGRVHADLLRELMAHPFIAQPPPKATGREEFGAHFTRRVLSRARDLQLDGADLVATATAFTAESIAENYRRFVLPRHPIDEVIVGGGGSYNPTLVRMIRERVGGIPVMTCEDLGVNSDAKEAIAFALLANDAALGLPTNVPGATGARRPVVMGKFLPGR